MKVDDPTGQVSSTLASEGKPEEEVRSTDVCLQAHATDTSCRRLA